MTADGKVAKGSDQLSELLSRCLRWSDVVLERKGVIPEQWKSTYDVLYSIRNELDKLSITPAWSLRETDLYDYQRKLDSYDEARVDGNWLDDEGKPAELYAQRVCETTANAEIQLQLTNIRRRCCISLGGVMATSTTSWYCQSQCQKHSSRSTTSYRP